MRHHPALPIALVAVCGVLVHATPASAVSFATWVAGTGSDTGTCPITAPCRTFQYAIGQTAAGGIINVLASGSFGRVSIDRPVSIIADGVEALVQTTMACPGGGKAAICISQTALVSLRGLTIDLASPGIADGILFKSGTELLVQDTVIRKAGGNGINFKPSTASAKLHLSNVTLVDSKNNGVDFNPTGGGIQTAALTKVLSENNGGGGIVFDGQFTAATINAVVRDSVAAGNILGISLLGSGANSVAVIVDHTTMSNNSSTGLGASGAGAVARIGDSVITGSDAAFVATSGGLVYSYATNKVDANAGNETPSSTIPLK